MPKQDNENNNGEVNRKCSETGYKNEERKPPIHPAKGMISHFVLYNEIEIKIFPVKRELKTMPFEIRRFI